MNDRTTTTTPDPTAIEDALLRIKVAANIIDTIKPVVRHLMDNERRTAA